MCHYDFPDSDGKRSYPLSGATKMNYIIKRLIDSGYYVELFSMAPLSNLNSVFIKGERFEKLGCSLEFPMAIGRGNFFLRILSSFFRRLMLLNYLFFKVKSTDTLLVYHSPGFFRELRLARKFKKFNLILEAEEIYHDVSHFSKGFVQAEEDVLSDADAYILSTELLDERINKNKKDSVAIYGTYLVEPQVVSKWDDGKIHVVYAGTFDPRKGGATAAITTAYLPDNYHVHILGFGSPNEVQDMKDLIEGLSVKSKATITFDGLLKGREFIEFIQKCHIGLSTQNPNAVFNGTSFPSKILSYMSNGLAVVSIKIDAVYKSKVGSSITYYEEQTPENIARAICKTDLSVNTRDIISKLDLNFTDEMNRLLNNFVK